MIFGKYGEMILANMEKNYPYRKQELELTGELDVKIFERERYIAHVFLRNTTKPILRRMKIEGKLRTLIKQDRKK